MEQTKAKRSIYKDFMLIPSIFLGCAVLLFSLTSYIMYNVRVNNKIRRTYTLSSDIANYMNKRMEDASYNMNFRGQKIQHSNSYSLEAISDILNEREIIQDNMLVVGFFEWADVNHSLLVSSVMGILEHPIDLSDRDYLKRSKKYPWDTSMGKVRQGALSREYIIPLAKGITDKSGRLLGYILHSIDVTKLNTAMQSMFEKDSSLFFVVVGAAGELAFYSKNARLPNDLDYSVLAQKVRGSRLFRGTFTHALPNSDLQFTYYHKVPHYPLRILVGVDKKVIFQKFLRSLIPFILTMLLLALIFILMFFYYRKTIMSPIFSLVQAVEAISNGRDVAIPKTNLYEISVLSEQIQKVRDFNRTLKEEIQSKTLSLQNSLSFNREIIGRIGTKVGVPFEYLKRISNELEENWSSMSNKDRHSYIQAIAENSKVLSKNISNISSLAEVEKGELNLNIEQDVDILSIIHSILEDKDLYGDRFSVTTNDMVDLKIACDRFRIAQVLRNLFDNALKSSYISNVDVYISSINNRSNLLVEIVDKGPGIVKGYGDDVFSVFSEKRKDYDPSLSNGVALALCKAVVIAHGGTIGCNNIMKNEEVAGAKFFFTLPYSNAKEKKTFNPNILINSKGGVVQLSKREIQCLISLQDGKTMKEIAVDLAISPRTVEHHIVNIKKKTKLKYKSELMTLGKSNITQE